MTSSTSFKRHINVVVFLAPRFPLLSLAICTETLRVANRELGANRFFRRLVTPTGADVASSSGIQITADASIDDIHGADVVIVLSSYGPEDAAAPEVLAWLRRQERMGALMACVDTGAYLLARAGLLGARHTAVHHEALPAFRALFYDVELIDDNAALEGRLASSAGGMATMDMMARILARFDDTGLADRVLRVLKYRPAVESGPPTSWNAGDVQRIDPRVARLVDVMLSNLDNAVSIRGLCATCNVDPSTARRLFVKQFGEGPARYLARLRLEHAASLLTNGTLRVGRVAALSGFSDMAAFSRAFRQRFGRSPTEHRRLSRAAMG